MKYEELAKDILAHIGGKENVRSLLTASRVCVSNWLTKQSDTEYLENAKASLPSSKAAASIKLSSATMYRMYTLQSTQSAD